MFVFESQWDSGKPPHRIVNSSTSQMVKSILRLKERQRKRIKAKLDRTKKYMCVLPCERQISRLKCQQLLQKQYFFFASIHSFFSFYLSFYLSFVMAHCLIIPTMPAPILTHKHAIYLHYHCLHHPFVIKMRPKIHFIDRMQRFSLKFIHHILSWMTFSSFQYPELENVLECASNKWYWMSGARCAWTELYRNTLTACVIKHYNNSNTWMTVTVAMTTNGGQAR